MSHVHNRMDDLIVEERTAPDYPQLGVDIGRLLTTKQHAYGDSFGQSGAILKVLYPRGVPVEAYQSMLTITRVIDKLFRIANHPAGDPMGENPWQDIAGYAILALAHTEKQDSITQPQTQLNEGEQAENAQV